MNNIISSYENFKINEGKEVLSIGFIGNSIKTLYDIGNLLDNTKLLLTQGKKGISYKTNQKLTNLTNFIIRLIPNMNKDFEGVIEEYYRLNNSSIFKDIDYFEELLGIQIMDSEDNELRKRKLEKRLEKLMELSNQLKIESKRGKMINFQQ